MQPSSEHPRVGSCIFCAAIDDLTREHVMPYGLGGRDQLIDASCKRCAKVTGSLEQRLLRGHWWPYRKLLKIKTRTGDYPKYQSVKLKPPWGDAIDAKVLMDEVPLVVFADFDPPSILRQEIRTDTPYAPRMAGKFVAPMPNRILVEGRLRPLQPGEQIEFPIQFQMSDLVRFIAKVAHCYAIYAHGPNACTEFFLPSYILGNGDGLLTYVGGASSAVLGPRLPGASLHALLNRRQGDYLSVYVQLFRDEGDLPPIYEVVVGRLAAQDVRTEV